MFFKGNAHLRVLKNKVTKVFNQKKESRPMKTALAHKPRNDNGYGNRYLLRTAQPTHPARKQPVSHINRFSFFGRTRND